MSVHSETISSKAIADEPIAPSMQAPSYTIDIFTLTTKKENLKEGYAASESSLSKESNPTTLNSSDTYLHDFEINYNNNNDNHIAL